MFVRQLNWLCARDFSFEDQWSITCHCGYTNTTHSVSKTCWRWPMRYRGTARYHGRNLFPVVGGYAGFVRMLESTSEPWSLRARARQASWSPSSSILILLGYTFHGILVLAYEGQNTQGTIQTSECGHTFPGTRSAKQDRNRLWDSKESMSDSPATPCKSSQSLRTTHRLCRLPRSFHCHLPNLDWSCGPTWLCRHTAVVQDLRTHQAFTQQLMYLLSIDAPSWLNGGASILDYVIFGNAERNFATEDRRDKDSSIAVYHVARYNCTDQKCIRS